MKLHIKDQETWENGKPMQIVTFQSTWIGIHDAPDPGWSSRRERLGPTARFHGWSSSAPSPPPPRGAVWYEPRAALACRSSASRSAVQIYRLEVCSMCLGGSMNLGEIIDARVQRGFFSRIGSRFGRP